MYPDPEALALLVALAHADTQIPVMVLRPRGTDLGLLPPEYRDQPPPRREKPYRESKSHIAYRLKRRKKTKRSKRDKRRNRR